MRREWVMLDDVDLYDDLHQLRDGVLWVDPKDGKTAAEHEAGIEWMVGLLHDGVKLMPPLLLRLESGRFKKLDGFKRIHAHLRAGHRLLEAFVAEPEDLGKAFPYDGLTLHARMGGQTYRKWRKVTEYEEPVDQHTGDGHVEFLYDSGAGFRIELREAIHVHWGPRGRNRLLLGRQDFDALTDAILETEL